MRGAVDLSALAAARDAQSQAAARKTDPNAARVIIDVTEATFESQVIATSQTVPVVVDLWATWCGPCKQLSPILEKLAVEYAGRWVLAKVDVDAQQQIAAAFQVQSIPTIVAVIKGQVLPLFQGALPEPQVRQYIEELLRVAGEAGVAGSVGSAPVETEQPPEEDPRWDAAALWALRLGYRLGPEMHPGRTPRLIGAFIRNLLLVQAAFCAVFGPPGWIAALLLIAAIPVSSACAAKFYAS